MSQLINKMYNQHINGVHSVKTVVVLLY